MQTVIIQKTFPRERIQSLHYPIYQREIAWSKLTRQQRLERVAFVSPASIFKRDRCFPVAKAAGNDAVLLSRDLGPKLNPNLAH